MEHSTEENTDGSSIVYPILPLLSSQTNTDTQKPVSSLRSHFESMLNMNKSSLTPSITSPMQASPATHDRLERLEDQRSRLDGRISLDIARDNGPHTSSPHLSD